MLQMYAALVHMLVVAHVEDASALLAAVAAAVSTVDVHVSGMQPQKVLPVMVTDVSAGMEPHEEASAPAIMLLDRSTVVSVAMFQLGRPRHALVPLILMDVAAVMPFHASGMLPLSAVLLRSSDRRFDSAAQSLAKAPVMLGLLAREMEDTITSEPATPSGKAGMVPATPLPSRLTLA